jgi:hypothetical protein
MKLSDGEDRRGAHGRRVRDLIRCCAKAGVVTLCIVTLACSQSEPKTTSKPGRQLPRTTEHPQSHVTEQPDNSPLVVQGEYARAWSEAVAAHRAIRDLTSAQRRIENYTFVFSEDAENVYVVFVPKIEKGSLPLGGENRLGRSAEYTVDKRSYRVVRRTFGE